MGLSEFELIDRCFRRAGRRADVVLGIGDDAAVLAAPAGRQLVVALDTLNEGVHFLPDTSPADLGWKALAVNLSDVAAMGAEPAWLTLSLSLPRADVSWVSAFADGLFALADRYRMALVGGDTTRGPLSVSVQVMGFAEPGRELRRSGAAPGQAILVSGTLGDAAAALGQLQATGKADAALRARLDRPEPRVELGRRLAGLASACIDISDGLLADLGHVLEASGCGARIELAQLPRSGALRAEQETALWDLQLAGGDDYELCFTVEPSRVAELEAAAAELGVPVTCIGETEKETGIRCLRPDGGLYRPPARGWDHFGDEPERVP
ncbi:MAG TPA: thiamine-phosphate kinase [Gammaproteobacteria bacterium]|nr:thiamine-phosphate kinase [Gammaproteobacteria bacterium]